MEDPVLKVERHSEAVTALCLNRPDRRNALTIPLMQRLCAEMDESAADTQRRVVILSGTGPAFCTGLDLREVADLESVSRGAEQLAQVLQRFLDSPLVTIAAVQGAAYAGGAGLMAACDFVVAAEGARICFPEVRRGIVPAVVSAVLRDRVHGHCLRELLLLAEPIDARRAQILGVVDRVVAGTNLLAEAMALAAVVVQGAPAAVRQTKRLLRETRSLDASAALQHALQFHRDPDVAREAAEGVAAWQARRPPAWSGGGA